MAMYNPYNNNFYMQDLQNMRDKIDRQMQQIQQNQIQQPVAQPITQNFQLAPNTINNELEANYANNIDEVRNTFVVKTGIFVTKDFATLWIKDVTGNIKTYRTEEVIELDEKDKKLLEKDTQILQLQKEINELKGMILDDNTPDSSNILKTATNKKSNRLSNDK